MRFVGKIFEIIIQFVETKLVVACLILYWFIVIVLCIFSDHLYGLNNFLIGITKYFYEQQDSMVTSATVLIGIYFTMYTIFAVYNSSSVIGKLYTNNFKRLLRLLKHALISSILVLIFGFMTAWLKNESLMITYLLNFFFNVYFIVTSIICGFYIYFIFKRDIEGLDKQKEENDKKEILLENLENFLDRAQKAEERRIDEENKKK